MSGQRQIKVSIAEQRAADPAVRAQVVLHYRGRGRSLDATTRLAGFGATDASIRVVRRILEEEGVTIRGAGPRSAPVLEPLVPRALAPWPETARFDDEVRDPEAGAFLRRGRPAPTIEGGSSAAWACP